MANDPAVKKSPALNPVVFLLGVIAALLAILVFRTFTSNGTSSAPKVLTPEPVGDPQRVREVAVEGQAYHSLAKGTINARVEDKAWSIARIINLGYMFEADVTRTIEKNDGAEIVAIYEFHTVRMVKTLSEVEDFRIEVGLPHVLVLGAAEYFLPGALAGVVQIQPLAEGLGRMAHQALLNSQASKVFANVDGLSGKTVRITYQDGVGVTSIAPVQGELTQSDEDFLSNLAPLSDYFVLPDLEIAEGDTWTVNAAQLIGLFDPTLRAIPSGEISLQRGKDTRIAGKEFANLSVAQGFVKFNTSDSSARRVATLEPRGSLTYNITGGYVSTATLSGRGTLEDVSTDHILFETVFRTEPEIDITYYCEAK